MPNYKTNTLSILSPSIADLGSRNMAQMRSESVQGSQRSGVEILLRADIRHDD